MAKQKTEEELIKAYNKAKEKLDTAEEEMRQHFNRKTMPLIKSAKTLEDILAIKESLIDMPYNTGKILLFRAIIITEEGIKKALKNKK